MEKYFGLSSRNLAQLSFTYRSLDMSDSTSSTLLENVRDAILFYKRAVSPPAISDVAKISTVKPITAISTSVKTVEEKKLYDILQGVLNIYAAYYMQAISILSAQLVSTKILKILDRLNPDRDINTVLTSLGSDVNNFKLESISEALESLDFTKKKYNLLALEDSDEENDTILSQSTSNVSVFDKLPFAVGKIIEAKFRVPTANPKESAEIAIPVVIRLETMVIPSDVIGYLLSYNQEEIRFSERLHKALHGQISFIKDFLLAQDLIEQQKRAMIKDPTGIYTKILKRLNNSRIYSLLTKNFSLSEISSVIVISEEEEKMIRRQFGLGLESSKVRKTVFDNIAAMMIVVIDKEWQQVSIYIKGQDEYSQNSFNDFKVASDKASDNVTELYKAFALGTPPSF